MAKTKRKKRRGRVDPLAHAKYACKPIYLPPELEEKAVKLAWKINPTNGPRLDRLAALAPDLLTDKEALSAVTQKTWGERVGRLTVGFMESPAAELQRKIVEFANKWGEFCGAKFTLIDRAADADIRVSLRAGGYWSYIGTDCLVIPKSQQTMNLQGFSLATIEAEFWRVVCHEFGHALGFPHEHARAEIIALLDPAKVIAYFKRTQGWSELMIRQQILTPLETSAIIATPAADQTSIMTYQFPGAVTRDGRPIPGGLTFSDTDRDFSGKVYPKAPLPTDPPPAASSAAVGFRIEGAKVFIKLGAGLTGVIE